MSREKMKGRDRDKRRMDKWHVGSPRTHTAFASLDPSHTYTQTHTRHTLSSSIRSVSEALPLLLPSLLPLPFSISRSWEWDLCMVSEECDDGGWGSRRIRLGLGRRRPSRRLGGRKEGEAEEESDLG